MLGDGWHLASGARLDNTSLSMCGGVFLLWVGLGPMAPRSGLMNTYYGMRKSNDADFSDPQGLSSLGVVDLDLSITPDVFGLCAFDEVKPLTCMLTG